MPKQIPGVPVEEGQNRGVVVIYLVVVQLNQVSGNLLSPISPVSL